MTQSFRDHRSTLYLVLLERRGEVEDEGGKGDDTGDGEEGTAVVSAGGGDEVGGVGGRLHDGSIDHHVGDSRGAASHG